MKTLPSRLLLLAGVLLGLPGCGPLFFAEVDLPEVCYTIADQTFPGVPVNASGSMTFPPQSFDLGQVLSSLPTDRLTARLHVTSGTMTLKSGVNDLGFISALSLDLVPDADAGQTASVELLNYTRDPNAAAPLSIDLASTHPSDIFPDLEGGKINASFTIAGTLPQQDWTVDFKVCVAASARIQYL